jgi:hypothetical protein
VEDKSLPLASTFSDYALLFGTFVHGSPVSPPNMGSSSIFTSPFRLKADDNTSTCVKGVVKVKYFPVKPSNNDLYRQVDSAARSLVELGAAIVGAYLCIL